MIRGVRPKSERWPRTERNQSAAPGAGPRSQVQRGRWRQPRGVPNMRQDNVWYSSKQLSHARIIVFGTACSSGSAVGCATCTVRAVRNDAGWKPPSPRRDDVGCDRSPIRIAGECVLGEASHTGPPMELRRLRRVSSTHHAHRGSHSSGSRHHHEGTATMMRQWFRTHFAGRFRRFC